MKRVGAVVIVAALLFVWSIRAIAVDCIDPQCVYGQDVVYWQTQDGNHWSLPRAWYDVWCLSGAAGCHTDRDLADTSGVATLSDAANGATDCPNTGGSGGVPATASTTGSTSNYTQIGSVPLSYCKRRDIGM